MDKVLNLSVDRTGATYELRAYHSGLSNEKLTAIHTDYVVIEQYQTQDEAGEDLEKIVNAYGTGAKVVAIGDSWI